MKPEIDVTVQLRYWEGRLEGLDEGIKAVGSPDKSKDKAAADSSVHLAVERATAGGWVDALRWVLKPAEDKPRENRNSKEPRE